MKQCLLRTQQIPRSYFLINVVSFFWQWGGVATVFDSSEFSATNTSFEQNTAATNVPRSVFAQMDRLEFLPIDSTESLFFMIFVRKTPFLRAAAWPTSC